MMFYLPVLSLLGLGHSFVATGPHKWRLNGVSSLQAIDVSSLPVDPSAFASVPNADSMIGDSVSDLQTLPLLLAGAFYLAYERRPQGTCNKELVDIRKSSVPNAGLGVYASKTIPSGTQIGTFPGSVVNLDACLASKKDDEARQRSRLISGLSLLIACWTLQLRMAPLSSRLSTSSVSLRVTIQWLASMSHRQVAIATSIPVSMELSWR